MSAVLEGVVEVETRRVFPVELPGNPLVLRLGLQIATFDIVFDDKPRGHVLGLLSKFGDAQSS